MSWSRLWAAIVLCSSSSLGSEAWCRLGTEWYSDIVMIAWPLFDTGCWLIFTLLLLYIHLSKAWEVCTPLLHSSNYCYLETKQLKICASWHRSRETLLLAEFLGSKISDLLHVRLYRTWICLQARTGMHQPMWNFGRPTWQLVSNTAIFTGFKISGIVFFMASNLISIAIMLFEEWHTTGPNCKCISCLQPISTNMLANHEGRQYKSSKSKDNVFLLSSLNQEVL